ncbi:MAG TPA: zinc ABC transporter substrate-binding protein [Solirubrobacteraceae bacterium]
MRRAALIVIAGLVVAGCSSQTSSSPGQVNVVAAENFWGSIAAQLAGGKAHVQSLIVNPAQDPHTYEPTAADARTMAGAQLAIVNGVGYDPWAPQLLAANPAAGRLVLTVGSLFGLHEGDNPHRWYDPTDVETVARVITEDLERLDPGARSYFKNRLGQFLTRDLASYHALIGELRSRYAGVPVGASESIFALQAPALGLRLITPYSFLKAISEGTEVTAQDTATTQRQITQHQIKLWVFNSQNTTPQVQQLNSLARQNHIPIVSITETLQPRTASFEQWQVSQLQALKRALHRATGR